MNDLDDDKWRDKEDEAIASTLARWTVWFVTVVGLYIAGMLLIVWVL